MILHSKIYMLNSVLVVF